MKQAIIPFLILFSFAVINAQTAENPNSPNFHNSKYFLGSEPESGFGANVVNVGDFNADGFEDLAISADGANNGAGKVYLYFGGETFDMRPDVVFEAPTGSDDFGYQVASAGDFNSDGFDDMVIVSKNYSTNNPTVMVYFGGPYFDATPDVYLQNYWNSAYFGNDVAGLGDVNGDGIDDIGVISGNSVGLYFGALNPAATTEMSMSLNHSSDYIAYCGDVNGDGYNDILTSSPQEGLSMIYKGGPELGNDPNVFFERADANSQYFGFSITGGGDINGDGLSDVVVGDMETNNYTGSAYLYLGSTDIFSSSNPRPADYIINGTDENNQFGSVVAFVKDMNGDGFDELAVGGSNINFMNIYYGKTHPDNTVSQRYSNSVESGYFFSIASLDFNNDGYNEVVAGDYESDKAFLFSTEYSGRINNYDYSLEEITLRVMGDYNGDGIDDFLAFYGGFEDPTYIITGGGPLDTNYDIVIPGVQLRSIGGDIDGDGFDDLYEAYSNSLQHDSIVFYFGNNQNIINSITVHDSIYLGLSSKGDYNGDGITDLILGNDTYRIIYGNQSRNNISVNETFYCRDQRGESILTVDINNDGYDDIFVPYRSDDASPLTYRLYKGSSVGVSAFSQSIDASFFGFPATSLEVENIIDVGDFNNDSYTDFVVSYVNDEVVHPVLVFGNSTGSNFNFIEIPLHDIIPYGESVSAKKGDFNGDGISDLLIFTSERYPEVYIYFGGNSTLSAPDISIYPDNDYAQYAYDAFQIADVNGDGLTDILVNGWAVTISDWKSEIYLSTVKNKAPYFKSVKDVPADQGGFVTLAWFKSGLDGGKVNAYQIERSIAPVGGGFAWEVIGNVPASHFNYYSYTAPTLNDQTPDYSGNTYFRITALTGNPDVFYRSNILSGHSVDNLAPVAPGGLKAVGEGTEARISWKLNSENDIKNYLVYRSINEEVNFDTLEVYGAVSDSVFVDESPLTQSAYYFVRAADIHGNIGDASSVLLQLTGVNDEDGLPTKFALGQNYPNPFNPTTTINYAVPAVETRHALSLQLIVYDILGRKIATLVNQKQAPGNYSVQFDASKLSSGIYYYTLRAGDFVATKKMILLK